MDVAVIAGALVGLMFLHQGDEFFGLPPFGLEIVVIGGGGSGVHHLNVALVIGETRSGLTHEIDA